MPSFTDFQSFAPVFRKMLEAEPDLPDGLDTITSAAQDLIERRIPIVFLKQFPDVRYPGLASYLSIVHVQSTLTRLHGTSPVQRSFEVQIERCDSHPIVKDLGFSEPLRPFASLFVHFDFAIGNGKEIIVCGTNSGRA